MCRSQRPLVMSVYITNSQIAATSISPTVQFINNSTSIVLKYFQGLFGTLRNSIFAHIFAKFKLLRKTNYKFFCTRGGEFSPDFLCPGGWGFELVKFSSVLKEKCRNFLICFKETGGSLKIRCSCAVSNQFLQKQ